MRNYERMRMIRGQRIGYEYDTRDDHEHYQDDRRRGMYGYKHTPRTERYGVEPGRDMPGYERMSAYHYGGDRGSATRHEPVEPDGMSYEDAEEWVGMMARPDGGRGARWKYEDTERIMREKKIQCDPVEFWAAMNAMYSDYYNVAKHFGVANDEFFAKMAEAFICDDDAVMDKVAAYWECIVRH